MHKNTWKMVKSFYRCTNYKVFLLLYYETIEITFIIYYRFIVLYTYDIQKIKKLSGQSLGYLKFIVA